MKKLTLTFALMMAITIVISQPSAFKYQTVVRDASGEVLSNQSVSFQISILQGSASGTNVYTETHNATTNQFGLVNLEVGNGTVVSGDFGTIDWGTDDFFLQIELDESGGDNYQWLGVSQLLSVPYAINARSSDDSYWNKSVNDISYYEGNVGIGTTSPHESSILDINSNSKGILIPRLTATEILTISNPDNGLTVYNTDDCKFYVYRECNTNWNEIELGTNVLLSYSIGLGGSCSNTVVNGIYKEQEPLNASNNIVIQAEVLNTGPWSIHTDTINGFSFSGSGIFETTGTVQVTLYGVGTPDTDQLNVFMARTDSNESNCLFEITVIPNNNGTTPGTAAPSCLAIMVAGNSALSGIYWLDPDGDGGNDPFECFCEMEVSGGGWTLVASMADDGNDYWTWDNQFYLFNGNAYGDIANFHINDYQSEAWSTLLGDEVMFIKGDDFSKYLVYDGIISSQSLSSKFANENIVVDGGVNPTSVGSWWQQCGNSLELRLQSPDSDSDYWSEGSKGFIWNSDNGDGCYWDDTGGGLSNALHSNQEYNWSRSLFYHQNFDGSSMVIFVR